MCFTSLDQVEVPTTSEKCDEQYDRWIKTDFSLEVGVNGVYCLLECYNESTLLKLMSQVGIGTKHTFLEMDRNWFQSGVDWFMEFILLERVGQFWDISSLSGQELKHGRLVRRVGRATMRIKRGKHRERLNKVFRKDNMRDMTLFLE